MEVGETRYLHSETLTGSQKHAKKYLCGYLRHKDMHKNENTKSEYWNQVTRMVFYYIYSILFLSYVVFIK